MKKIQILGTGCPKCKRLEQLVREAVTEERAEATVTKVEDIDAISEYPVMSTPALVINEEVVSSGRLPRKDEIMHWIRQAAG